MSMIRKLLSITVLFAAMQTQAQDSTKTKQLDDVVGTATKPFGPNGPRGQQQQPQQPRAGEELGFRGQW